MIAGSSGSLSTPGTPSVTARTAGSNETPVGSNGTFGVKVTATNYFGETVASSAATVSGGTTASQVVDVTIAPVTGAMNYNIYVTTSSTYYLMAQGVGGVRFTLQGTPPASGTTPPSADTGTGKNTRFEGVIPVLSGLSSTAGVYPTTPTNWIGGYYNNAVGTHLSYNAVYAALKALWQSTSNQPGAFRADPAELISSGIDIANLSTDVISQGTGTNYELFIQQSQVGDVTVGAAVSQFQNPLTKSIMKLVVHPWYTQGNATLLSYQLPQTWTNVANAWEMNMVQDYVSIAWPVIDATFRYSIDTESVALAKVARQGDLPWKTIPDRGTPPAKGNPERLRCPRACRDCMGSDLCHGRKPGGIAGSAAGDRGTVRACTMGKCKSHRETRWPAAAAAGNSIASRSAR
jgi:hypothetical protein